MHSELQLVLRHICLGIFDDTDVNVFVAVTDDAVDVSLIKSLLSSEGDASVIVETFLSIGDGDEDDEGSLG